MGRLVRGQHVYWEYLSQGGHEHWGELSKGGVVQGRIKVISARVPACRAGGRVQTLAGTCLFRYPCGELQIAPRHVYMFTE